MKIVYSLTLEVDDVRWAEQELDGKPQEQVRLYLDEQLQDLYTVDSGTLTVLGSTVVKKHSKTRNKLGVDTEETLW